MFFLIVLSCLSTIQLVLCADSIDRERQRLSSKPVFYGEHFVSQKDRSIDLAIKRFNSSGMLIPERYRHMSQRDFVSYVLYGLKDKVTVAKKTLKSSVALDFFQQRYIRAISDEVFFIYSEDMRKCFYRIHGNDNLYKQFVYINYYN